MSDTIQKSLLLIQESKLAWSCTKQGECHRSLFSLSMALDLIDLKLYSTNQLSLKINDCNIKSSLNEFKNNISSNLNQHFLYKLSINCHVFIIEIFNNKARFLSLWGGIHGFLDFMKVRDNNKFINIETILEKLEKLWFNMSKMTSEYFDVHLQYLSSDVASHKHEKYMDIYGPILILSKE
jgi:hypothetical protein